MNREELLYQIATLEQENKQLKELVEAYQEEHNTTFQEWGKELKEFKKEHKYYEKAMNIIEEMIVKLKELGDSNE